MNNYYLAIDLGASSGRHIIGFKNQNGKIILREVYRFRTGMDDSPDGLVWDINRIYKDILFGIKEAFKKYKNIISLSIDAWGVDYVLLDGDKPIPPYYAYRNNRCLKAEKVINSIINPKELYKINGIQHAPFNTINQLYADKIENRLERATDYLMLPCYFSYLLTGQKVHEYTNESTTGLLNARTGKYSSKIIDSLDLPKNLFTKMHFPSEKIGVLLPNIEKEVKGNCNVVLCASHDTASAFEAVDSDEDSVIISSGTWSLLGIKAPLPIINEKAMKANYTNEGGPNYIRFLKNIMGMWINNKIKEKSLLDQDYIDKNITSIDYRITFDVNDPSLRAPTNMKDAVLKLLSKCPPRNDLELLCSVYRSMAKSYNVAIKELEDITERNYQNIYIVGGGAKNKFLNNLVEKYTGKRVIALPIEASALGNIKIQMKANGDL